MKPTDLAAVGIADPATVHARRMAARGIGTRVDGALLAARRWAMWCLLALDDQRGTRFSDLAGEPGLSRRVLSEELGRLEGAGLVLRRTYSRRPLRSAYWLTRRGRVAREAHVELLHVLGGGRVDAPNTAAPAPGDDYATRPADRLAATVAATIAPLVAYDDQYRASMLATLRAYIEADASVSVAARTLVVHRHTVRYRLSRVRDLSGLNVDILSERERLVDGLRSHDELVRRRTGSQ